MPVAVFSTLLVLLSSSALAGQIPPFEPVQPELLSAAGAQPYPAVVSLDLSDPAAPWEVARLMLPDGWVPHWLALEPNSRRLVLTGYGAMADRVVLLTHDPATGALAIDDRFREAGTTIPGVRVTGVPHGAVFSRKQ
jgi:hypothetical protein